MDDFERVVIVSRRRPAVIVEAFHWHDPAVWIAHFDPGYLALLPSNNHDEPNGREYHDHTNCLGNGRRGHSDIELTYDSAVCCIRDRDNRDPRQEFLPRHAESPGTGRPGLFERGIVSMIPAVLECEAVFHR